jgi:hypothetical protein
MFEGFTKKIAGVAGTDIANVTDASLPGGHFFVDQFAAQAVQLLTAFLLQQR